MAVHVVPVALAVAAAMAVPAWAEPSVAERELAQERFRTGVKAFRANKFDVAVQSFEQAYELDPQPETAFSIAQANRLQYYLDKSAWRLQRALQLYEVYLAAMPAGRRARDAIAGMGEVEPLLRELRGAGELVPYAPEPKTQLVVGTDVDAAQVRVDGARAALWEPIELTPGPHVVEVEAAGYEVARRQVTVPEGQFLPIDVELKAKPGRLALQTEPGAVVYVDGMRRGTTSEAGLITIPLAPGPHFVSTTRRGRDSWSRALTIERDAELTAEAELVPTAQRRVARWILLSAGGLAVGAIGTGLWSYAARHEAQEIDEARRDLTASPADLARYNDLVDAAELRQDVALGLAVGALAVGALGLGMWWFDQPPPDSSDGLDVRPVVAPSAVGLLLEAQF